MAAIRESWERMLFKFETVWMRRRRRWRSVFHAVPRWRRQPMARPHFSPIFLILPQTLAVVSRNWSDSNSGERCSPPRRKLDQNGKMGRFGFVLGGCFSFLNVQVSSLSLLAILSFHSQKLRLRLILNLTYTLNQKYQSKMAMYG